MTRHTWLLTSVVALLAAAGVRAEPAALRAGERLLILGMSPLPPPPASPTNHYADDPAAAALGALLFEDCGLSPTGDVACATCHDPTRSFGDGLVVARGAGAGRRNTQALWNVAHFRWLFWDGRADSLWAQALQPIEAPLEMNGSRALVYQRIAAEPTLRAGFESLFGSLPPPDPAGITRVFVITGKCLEAFERTLVSDDAPFDRYVARLSAGERGAPPLTDNAVRGLRLFIGRANCILCHNGPLLSDSEFHNIGLGPSRDLPLDIGRFNGISLVLEDGFNGRGRHSDEADASVNDKLRYLKPRPESLGEMRTPSLRNIALTAPYMHDGRFATLPDVLRFYSTLEEAPAIGEREATLTPLRFSDREIADLVAFLESLSDAPTSRDHRQR